MGQVCASFFLRGLVCLLLLLLLLLFVVVVIFFSLLVVLRFDFFISVLVLFSFSTFDPLPPSPFFSLFDSASLLILLSLYSLLYSHSHAIDPSFLILHPSLTNIIFFYKSRLSQPT